jgi:hypothetical protein
MHAPARAHRHIVPAVQQQGPDQVDPRPSDADSAHATDASEVAAARRDPDDDESSHYQLDPEPATPKAPPPPTPAQVEAARRAELRELDPTGDAGDDEEQVDPEPPPTEPLVSPLLKDDAMFAWVGGGLLLAAGALAGLGSEKQQLARAIATIYNGGLFAVLGVVAAWAYTHLDPRPLGSWRVLAPRMLLAVAVFQLVANVLQGGFRQLVLTLVGVVAYGATLALSLRWRPRRVVRVAFVHYVLGLVVYLALTLHAWATGG